MAYYAVTNGEGYVKVFDSGEFLTYSLDLQQGTGEIVTVHADLILPEFCGLIIISDDLDSYRALFGAQIGLPYPMTPKTSIEGVADWFSYMLHFEDQQAGTDLSDFSGVREAVHELISKRN